MELEEDSAEHGEQAVLFGAGDRLHCRVRAVCDRVSGGLKASLTVCRGFVTES